MPPLAFNRLSRCWDPKTGEGDIQKFKRIHAAYVCLIDSKSRAAQENEYYEDIYGKTSEEYYWDVKHLR